MFFDAFNGLDAIDVELFALLAELLSLPAIDQLRMRCTKVCKPQFIEYGLRFPFAGFDRLGLQQDGRFYAFHALVHGLQGSVLEFPSQFPCADCFIHGRVLSPNRVQFPLNHPDLLPTGLQPFKPLRGFIPPV